ncbi:TPA: 50S ribosomal protein L21 [Candidatus Dependentiae bacterium]|nr:MAG: 50S ribosomal protein L21 [candidate division TM6 bacterium GW2011_GWF2_36_131]KKQ03257.1 MAG: 50S ribosomal protein L21 [candidate division TM6 bacterium GW2011_GWE2_36_25]KKQ19848.1 MAG: 50S ribosomal protein L21 [candidate division TM6 bacterium GW2011_GWA2_36_9]HBR70315.1 50S ribosomal protein L21 [Candidatus Dependentiae bacterium]HCU00860.1 50S ribosomal protein L21 [Candidatus Dependentiae bacterium]
MVEKKTTAKKSTETAEKPQKKSVKDVENTAKESASVEKKAKEVTEKVEKEAVAERYAIFRTGGKQYQAIEGKTVAIEKVTGELGDKVEFKEVLFRKSGDGKFEIGKPLVEGAVIKASIVRQDKSPKVVVFKFKRRHKSRVKKGHRQPFTVIRIEAI